jgi:Domain of unknown function (DUF4149)
LTFLRFIRLLSLTLWTGSIFFFAAVEAPILFSVLPTRALAGLVVGRSLSTLHWIGLGCGLIFLLTCVVMAMLQGGASIFHARDLLLFAMMAMTLYLHFGLERRMLKLRDSIGVIDNVSVDDPRRVEFNRMHQWSTKLEGSVFLLGLGLLYLVVREQETSPRRY